MDETEALLTVGGTQTGEGRLPGFCNVKVRITAKVKSGHSLFGQVEFCSSTTAILFIDGLSLILSCNGTEWLNRDRAAHETQNIC